MIARALRRLAGWLYRMATRIDGGRGAYLAWAGDKSWTERATPLALPTLNERPTLRMPAVRDSDLMETLTPVPGAYPELEWKKEKN